MTPSRRIEYYSEEMLDHGYPPLPDFEEPQVSPRSRGDLAPRSPLIPTSATDTHLGGPRLRGRRREVRPGDQNHQLRALPPHRHVGPPGARRDHAAGCRDLTLV